MFNLLFTILSLVDADDGPGDDHKTSVGFHEA